MKTGRLPTILGLSLLAGCATLREPVVPALRDAPDKIPVVFIPGITGTQLRDATSGRVIWGDTTRFFLPPDGGYALARPLRWETAAHDTIEPYAPILDVRFFGVVKAIEVYGALQRVMLRNGYQLGDLRHPKPGDNFFFFLYDWRQDNVRSAGELARQLEALRLARGDAKLRVVLACQSNGAHIARYFLKYGGAPLAEAEAGTAQPPANIEVQKLILIATSNGGSLRTLHELNRGREYFPFLGRDLLPETLFTFPSLYEDLPVYRRDWFFDTSGRRLDVDLFDAANWERYGWSIYERDTQARLRQRRRQKIFGDVTQRGEFLREALHNAQRFRTLLDRDVVLPAATRYYLVQSLYTPTIDRALLERRNKESHTFFNDDAEVNHQAYLKSLAVAPGDGHATLDSQMWLSPQEVKALARSPEFVEGGHFNMIVSPATQRWLLEFLAE